MSDNSMKVNQMTKHMADTEIGLLQFLFVIRIFILPINSVKSYILLFTILIISSVTLLHHLIYRICCKNHKKARGNVSDSD